MTIVCNENMCTGCKACIEICPQKAITICDDLSCYNAVIGNEKCMECDACHNVCPQNSEIELKEPIQWKEGWAASRTIRENSSSGGLASELMRTFLHKHGIVCSCKFADGKFGFSFLERGEDIIKFSGSKYVKSDPEGVYKRIRNYLKEGTRVLFVGLPCQVAAVKLFCGDKYSQLLYTVDLICHGTPSPKLLDMFLNENGYSLKQLEYINFRKKNNFRLYPDHQAIAPDRMQDLYTFTFLKGLDYTENCYSCKYARQGRVSDITIGDSWGSELPKEEREKGVSIILVQTQKGEELLGQSKIYTYDIDKERAIYYNKQLQSPTQKDRKRKLFFGILEKRKSFNAAVRACYPIYHFKQKIKYLLIKTGIMKYVRRNGFPTNVQNNR